MYQKYTFYFHLRDIIIELRVIKALCNMSQQQFATLDWYGKGHMAWETRKSHDVTLSNDTIQFVRDAVILKEN